jgi:hypothetical protein
MATTVEEFVKLVFTYARTHGQPFLKWQEQAELRAYISRQLFRFVEQTKVLYDDNVTFDTTASDDGTYDLMDTDVFSRAVLEPEVVLVEDAPLLGDDGLPGLVSVAQANDYAADYRTIARAQPQKALLIPPQTLRLIPRPDAAYDVTVSGWVQHFDLTGASAYDTTPMEIGDGTIDAAAKYIAGEMILVGGEGPSLEAGNALIQIGLSQAKKASGRAASFLQGPMVRGRRTSSTVTLS